MCRYKIYTLGCETGSETLDKDTKGNKSIVCVEDKIFGIPSRPA